MNVQRALSDAAIRRAFAELSDGRDAAALTADVLGIVEARPQVRVVGLPPLVDRRWVLVGLAMLLALGAMIAAGMRPSDQPAPRLRGPWLLVLQRWNGLVDPDSVVEHTAIDPESGVSLLMRGAPRNATNLHWTLDGSRVTYLTVDAQIRNGLGGPGPRVKPTGMAVADGDFKDPLLVNLTEPIEQYAVGDLGDGVAWAPTGDRFAVGWSTGSCNSGPDCLPDGNIDIFDREGRWQAGFVIRAGDYSFPVWSRDGRDIGWYTSTCPDGRCTSTAFAWHAVDGTKVGDEIAIPGIAGVTWGADGRLMAYTTDGFSIDRVFSMLPDGSDVRDVPGFEPAGYGVLSPDGSAIASRARGSKTLRIDDLKTGHRVELDLPDQLDMAGWSPDGRWVLLWTDTPEDASVRVFSIVGSDGRELRRLGEGENFAWAPASAISGK